MFKPHVNSTKTGFNTGRIPKYLPPKSIYTSPKKNIIVKGIHILPLFLELKNIIATENSNWKETVGNANDVPDDQSKD